MNTNNENNNLGDANPVMPHIEVEAEQLPPIVREMYALGQSPEERDMLLLGTLVAVSAALPGLRGKYDRRTVFPHMYLFVSAPPSAGKGCLTFCRELVMPIHNHLAALADAKYQEELESRSRELGVKSKMVGCLGRVEVPQGGLIIQANSSATAFIQTLNDYGGEGFMFETEGDTVAQAIKLDNYSDILRKAFHHEDFGFNRRKNQEKVYLKGPKLAVCLSGTPGQISGLIPDAENGLFSRFMFLSLQYNTVWKDVFREEGETVAEEVVRSQGKRLYQLWKSMREMGAGVEFSLSRAQRERFNRVFAEIQEEYAGLYGVELVPSIRRLGVMAYRIAMVMTALRGSGSGSGGGADGCRLVCSDEDYELAMGIVRVLADHASKVFLDLPKLVRDKLLEKELRKPLSASQIEMLERLPEVFSTREALAVAHELGISTRRAFENLRKYVEGGRTVNPRYGRYRKL